MKETFFKIQNLRKNRGFTLFIAVLVGALSLSIGYSLAGLAAKQLIISTSGRESQYAFYAADSGIECAFYWDFKFAANSAFATTNPPSTQIPTNNVRCNNQDITTNWYIQGNSTRATTTFVYLLTPQPYCVQVQISKWGSTTTVESRGYNTGSIVAGTPPTCLGTTNTRRLERAIRVRY